jgi:hypothetical protein
METRPGLDDVERLALIARTRELTYDRALTIDPERVGISSGFWRWIPEWPQPRLKTRTKKSLVSRLWETLHGS